jgi:hypothetical protein
MLGIFKESSKFENGILHLNVYRTTSKLYGEGFILSTIPR